MSDIEVKERMSEFAAVGQVTFLRLSDEGRVRETRLNRKTAEAVGSIAGLHISYPDGGDLMPAEWHISAVYDLVNQRVLPDDGVKGLGSLERQEMFRVMQDTSHAILEANMREVTHV